MIEYKQGINLGGWLCQYDPSLDPQLHFDEFITEQDIELIASWGADHVRLPFESGVLDAFGFRYLDRCVEWCRARGLGVLLDLHFVDGMSVDPAVHFNPLFDESVSARFLSLWDRISRHYAGTDDGVRFELLNEVLDQTGCLWNPLWQQALRVVRRSDPDRVVVVGGNQANDVRQLQALALAEDAHVQYTFHYYEPLPFTHQKAPFDVNLRAFDHAYDYPCDIGDELYAFLKTHPEYGLRYGHSLFLRNDAALIRRNLRLAADFAQYAGRSVYCGEFGVYEGVAPQAAADWTRDCAAELRRLNIGYAYWCYKQTDFGIVDAKRRVVRPLLPPILFDQQAPSKE